MKSASSSLVHPSLFGIEELYMADRATVITTVEGPKGSADVIEIFTEGSNQPAYQVHFQGKIDTYVTEGEASIEAMEAVGN